MFGHAAKALDSWNELESGMQLAGPKQSGINVVKKAAQAVNTGKVLLALNSISNILKVLFPRGWL